LRSKGVLPFKTLKVTELSVMSGSANVPGNRIVVLAAATVLSMSEMVCATVGAELLKVIENGGAAVLALLAVSVAAPAATLTVTAPLAVGVMVAVYVEPLTGVKLLTVPFVTATSLAVKPVTDSLK